MLDANPAISIFPLYRKVNYLNQCCPIQKLLATCGYWAFEVQLVWLRNWFLNFNNLNRHKSKITADGDCSHEIKRCLLLGRKVMTNLDSILKYRDITLPKNACIIKAMVFLVVMYGCESWTVKKAEHQRIDAVELWCWTWESLGLQGDPASPS